MTRTFPIGVVLSVTTGRLVVKPFSLVHEALDFLTGDQLFTHALPRAMEFVSPKVLERFPELCTVNEARLDALLAGTTKETAMGACDQWVAEMAALLGRDAYDLEPVAAFERKNPIAELREMTDKPITVVVTR